MTGFVIDNHDAALEAAQQYTDLGLPMPVDLAAYLESNGVILVDGTYLTEEEEELFLGQR